MKKKVLFICVHNSARSQMAEAFLNRLGEERFEATSAGLEPTTINPLVVEAMQEIGYDLSNQKTKGVFSLYREGRLFDYVITVCKESVESKCPIFPGIVKRLQWEFDDPAQIEGTMEERLAGVRRIRDQIKAKVEDWLREGA
jgi:arsenate reductase